MASNSTTFIKITNQDIYKEIIKMKELNAKQHSQILEHQQYTNGKVKLNRWIATTALTLIVTALPILLSLK